MNKKVTLVVFLIIILGLSGIASATPISMQAITKIELATGTDDGNFHGATLEILFTADSAVTPDNSGSTLNFAYSNFNSINMSINITNRPNSASDLLGLTAINRLNVGNYFSASSFDTINFDSRTFSGGIGVGGMSFYLEPQNYLSGTGAMPNLEFLLPLQNETLTLHSVGNFTYNSSYYYHMNQLSFRVNPNSDPVPEPATMLLFGLGLLGLAGVRRKK